jgi:hypothetical protein
VSAMTSGMLRMGAARVGSRRVSASRAPWSSWSVVGFAFTFLFFFPNPALPLGRNVGISIGEAVALGLAALAILGGIHRSYLVAAYVLFFPLVLSAFFAVGTPSISHVSITVRYLLIVYPLAFMPFVASSLVFRNADRSAVIGGAATAMIVHFLVGVYQMIMFSRGEFPFPALYQNPGFFSFATDEYANVVGRPFGLYPEASAMAASSGPWIVMITGFLLNGKSRSRMPLPIRRLAITGVIAGTTLELLSRSGYLLVLLVCLTVLAVPRGKKIASHLLPTLVGATCLGALAWAAVASLGDRLSLETNTSWQLRIRSIEMGLGLLNDSTHNLIFGVGTGLASLTMAQHFPGYRVPGSDTQIITIWSVIGRYVVETGLVGVFALLVSVTIVGRGVARSGARLVGLAAITAWLFGLGLGTSYFALGSPWLFLGALLAWPALFPAADPVVPSPQISDHTPATPGFDRRSMRQLGRGS